MRVVGVRVGRAVEVDKMEKRIVDSIKTVFEQLNIEVVRTQLHTHVLPICPYNMTVYVPYTIGFFAFSFSDSFINYIKNNVCFNDLECEDILNEMGNFITSQITKDTSWNLDFPVLFYKNDMLPVLVEMCNLLVIDTNVGPVKVLYI